MSDGRRGQMGEFPIAKLEAGLALKKGQIGLLHRRLAVTVIDDPGVVFEQIDADFRVRIEQRHFPNFPGEAQAHLDGALRPPVDEIDAAAAQRQVKVEVGVGLVQLDRTFQQQVHRHVGGILRNVAVQEQVGAAVGAQVKLALITGQTDEVVGREDRSAGGQAFPARLVAVAIDQNAWPRLRRHDVPPGRNAALVRRRRLHGRRPRLDRSRLRRRLFNRRRRRRGFGLHVIGMIHGLFRFRRRRRVGFGVGDDDPVRRHRLPYRDDQGTDQQDRRQRQGPDHPAARRRQSPKKGIGVVVLAVVAGAGAGVGLAEGNGFAAPNQAVHAFARRGRHEGRFAEDEREDLMTRSDFGEVDVGFEASFFEFGDLLRGQFVFEILGDGVGVKLIAGAAGGRRGEAAAASDLFDASHQFLGGVAFGDFLAEFLDFVRFQGVVQVG